VSRYFAKLNRRFPMIESLLVKLIVV